MGADLDDAEDSSDAPAPPPVVTPEPIAEMPTCGNAQTILAWATSVASIAEETINQTFRSSLEAIRPKTIGMARGRRAKNGWYDGIEVDRKTVSQYDRMDFMMGRAGGWEVGMAYRSRLVRLAQWRGKEPTPSARWDIAQQSGWIAAVKKELIILKKRMQGKVRDEHREIIDGYIQKRKAHFDAGRVGIMVDSVFGRRRPGGH